MRISETKVVQHVESDPPQVVIVDELNDAEVSFSGAEFWRLVDAIEYFKPHMIRV